MLTGAPRNGLRLLYLHFLRFEFGCFMGTIAEWLALRQATGAPPIGAWFHFLNDWRFLENMWF